MRWVVVVLLAFAGLAENSIALPVAGTLAVEGSFSLPAEATFAGNPVAVLQNDTSSLATFTATAPHATVTIYELHRVKAGELVGLATTLEPTARTHHLRNLTMELQEGDATGFLGAYPARDARLRLDAASSLEVLPTDSSRIEWANAQRTGPEDAPNIRHYARDVTGPHFLAEGVARVLLEGAGALKINGPDLRISAENGNLTVETGEIQTSPAESIRRWAYVTFEEANATWEAPGLPVIVATRAADATWDGAVAMRTRSAKLQSTETEYAAENSMTTLVGAFQATMTPAKHDRSVLALVEVTGDLGSTDMQAHRASAPAGRIGPAWWIGGLIVGLAVLGVAVPQVRRAMMARRIKRAQEWTPRQMVGFARAALEEHQYEEAAGWFKLARMVARTSAIIPLEEAHALYKSGEYHEALKLYQSIARAERTGEAALMTAALLLETGASEGQAEAYFILALEKDPDKVFELELGGAAFTPGFLARPSVTAAMKRARDRGSP